MTEECLADHDLCLDTLYLTPATDGSVAIPRYWNMSGVCNHTRCSHLVGPCGCGKVHTADEKWVEHLLIRHVSEIIGVPAPKIAGGCVHLYYPTNRLPRDRV
jgi:hypothetical protein